MKPCDLLRRRRAATVPPVPCASTGQGAGKNIENQSGSPGSLSSLENAKGWIPQSVDAVANDSEPLDPEADANLLLESLKPNFTGAVLHDIDDDLADMTRLVMLMMGWQARAELADLIDDYLSQPEGSERLLVVLEGRIDAQEPATWLDWIKFECPLVEHDAEFVGKALERLAPKDQEQAAHRYMFAWEAAAEAEALPHRIHCKADSGQPVASTGRWVTDGHPHYPSACHYHLAALAKALLGTLADVLDPAPRNACDHRRALALYQPGHLSTCPLHDSASHGQRDDQLQPIPIPLLNIKHSGRIRE